MNSVHLVNIILLYRVLNLWCSMDWGHLAAPVISPDPGRQSILQTCIQHLTRRTSCTALHSEYVLLNSGGRNRVPPCKHNRCTQACVHPTVSQVNEQIAPDGGEWWGALKAKWCWMCTVLFFPRLQLSQLSDKACRWAAWLARAWLRWVPSWTCSWDNAWTLGRLDWRNEELAVFPSLLELFKT